MCLYINGFKYNQKKCDLTGTNITRWDYRHYHQLCLNLPLILAFTVAVQGGVLMIESVGETEIAFLLMIQINAFVYVETNNVRS